MLLGKQPDRVNMTLFLQLATKADLQRGITKARDINFHRASAFFNNLSEKSSMILLFLGIPIYPFVRMTLELPRLNDYKSPTQQKKKKKDHVK